MKVSFVSRTITLLVVIALILIAIWVEPHSEAADLKTQGSKISSFLAFRLEMKKQMKQSEESRDEMPSADIQSLGEMTRLGNEKVFLYFAKPPTTKQVNELGALGVEVYPDSWIPPVGDFSNGFVLADIPIENIDSVAARNYIHRIDSAEQLSEPQNDQARSVMNVASAWASGYNGTGVTVAVLDSGIDSSNPDFPTLNTSNSKDYSNYPVLDDSITNTATGHGTHVTGSVLGRGVNSATYKGVAPGANLVFLKIGNDSNGGASSEAIVYAIEDAVDIYHADIITISYGGSSTYHDGTDAKCQAVDYAVSQGAAVFIAAGNNGARGWHYSGIVSAGLSPDIPITISSGSSFLSTGLVWDDGPGANNDLSLQYYDSSHNLLAPSFSRDQESERGIESKGYLLSTPTSGTCYFKVHNSSLSNQFFHIYYYGGSDSVAFNTPDPNYTLSCPAEADGAIAVGAYVTRKEWTNYEAHEVEISANIGTISTFSSRGPRVDTGSQIKPEVVAPGQAIISVRDNDVYPWPDYNPNVSVYNNLIIDNNGLNLNGSGPADYFVMSGTSMASPMAAGIGALLLDKNSALTPAQVRHTLEVTAADKGTSGPDNIYGWGLINASSALNSVTTLSSFSDSSHTAACDSFSNFSTPQTVYLSGTVYLHNHIYSVRFYDGSGGIVESMPVTSSGTGSLATSYSFSPETGAPGSWHAVICEPEFPLSDTFNSASPYTIVSDDFNVSPFIIAFSSPAREVTAGIPSDVIAIQTRDVSNDPINLDHDTVINLISSSPNGVFSISDTSWINVNSVTIPGGENSTAFYYKDTSSGLPLITASGSAFSSVSQQETVNPDIPAKIRVETAAKGSGTVVPAQNVTAGNHITLYSIIRDQYSNFISNSEGNWSLVNKTGNINDSDLVASGDNCSAVFIGNLTGTANIQVQSPGLESTNSGLLTVVFGPVSGLSVSGFLDPIIAGTQDQFSVTARDSLGNTVTSYTGTVHFSSSDGQAVLPPNHAFTGGDAGTHIFQATLKTAGTKSITAVDTINSAITGTQGNIAVNPGPVSKLAVSGYPSSITTGNSGNFTVTAQDTYSNRVSTYDGTIRFSSSDLQATLPGHYSFIESDQGAKNFSAILKTVGSQSITATDNETGSITGTQNNITVKKKSSGGGGGGGGGGGSPAPTGKIVATDLYGTHPVLMIGDDGKTLDSLTSISPDGKLTLNLPAKTQLSDSSGKPAGALTAKVMENPPALPAATSLIGVPYSFGPEGTTFNPPATFIYRYTHDQIPEGVNEADISLAYYDDSNAKWIPLPGILDTSANTLTVNISHFSIYAVIGPKAANISLSALDIQPSQAFNGDKITITVTLNNTGGKEGTYPVQIYINGVGEPEKVAAVNPQASQKVTFEIVKQIASDYVVTIGKLSGNFKISEPVPSPTPGKPEPEITPTPEQNVLFQTPIPSPYSKSDQTPASQGPNWILIGLIIVGILLAGLVLLIIMSSRSKKRA
jgi:subtilisin family serine protease